MRLWVCPTPRRARSLLLAVLVGLPLLLAASDPKPVSQQASDYLEWGRLKEAKSLLASALAEPANQQNAPLIALYSHVMIQFGEMRAGMDLARRAVALDKNCAACHLYLFEAMADKAKTYSQMHALLQLPKLKKQLETAAALDPMLGDVQWGWIDLDLQLPKALGGGEAAALEHADKLRQIDPVDGRLARASIFESSGENDAALTEYRAAAREHPDDPRGVFALGQALYKRGAYTDAEPYLARALLLNPKSALYSGYQAAALTRLKKLADARRVLEAAAARHPESRLGDYLVAEALHADGADFPWARQLLTNYLAVPPEPGQPSADQARVLLGQLG